MGEDLSVFSQISCFESHLNSMKLVARKEVDATTLDSSVLRIKLRCEQLPILQFWDHSQSNSQCTGRTCASEAEGSFAHEPSSARRKLPHALHPRRVRAGAICSRHLRALRPQRARLARVRAGARHPSMLRAWMHGRKTWDLEIGQQVLDVHESLRLFEGNKTVSTGRSSYVRGFVLKIK